MRNICIVFMLILMGACSGEKQSPEESQTPESLLLKNYEPESIFQVPETNVKKAKYQAIDIHAHDYASNKKEVKKWVQAMDSKGIRKTIILTQSTGSKFDSIVEKYSGYPDRFEIWCGLDYSGYKSDSWPEGAIEELERCHDMGAEGVGELGDKGFGLSYCDPSAKGMHINDERMKPILQKCAELNMPVNVHIADPYWMYIPMDSTNDGLMNAWDWKIDTTNENILLHGELLQTLEEAVRDNPQTTFIVPHFLNCTHDLSMLGKLFEKYPNLYADNSARYAETAAIPRFVQSFYKKYPERLLYGTDMEFYIENMYETTFRILETPDEHFYPEVDVSEFNYHWPLYGINLPDEVLQQVYQTNAIKIIDNTN